MNKHIELSYHSLKFLANDIQDAILGTTDGSIRLEKITNDTEIFISIAAELERIYLERSIYE